MIQLIKLLLLPITVLYWAATKLRNVQFDLGIKPHRRFPLPVICVGNITVGGTGKTPHIEYLVRIAHKAGTETATLSRGYKRKTKGFVLHTDGMAVSQIGDEPKQIADKFPNLHVAVCEDRVQGILSLTKLFPSLGCILLDDAYQHRHVQPSMSILLTDYNRPIWNDWVFPSGMMREGYYARLRAHVVVVSKCPNDMTVKEADKCRKVLALHAWQRLFFTTVAYGAFIDLRTARSFEVLGKISVLTGIAQHEAFVHYISSRALVSSEAHFPDHHLFTDKELRRIFKKADKHGYSIVTTEKDASRIAGHHILDEFPHVPVYYLPIQVEILFGQAQVFEKLISDHILLFNK